MERKDTESKTLGREAPSEDLTQPRDNRNLAEKARDAMTGSATRTQDDTDARRSNRSSGVEESSYEDDRPSSDAEPTDPTPMGAASTTGGARDAWNRDDAQNANRSTAQAGIPHVAADAAASTASSARANAGSDAADALLPSEALSGFQSRWQQIQIGFVDEPRTAVRDAEALVNDVVSQLTEVFKRQSKSLEQTWSGGNEASTEEMRVALQRYRSFFQRLLTF